MTIDTAPTPDDLRRDGWIEMIEQGFGGHAGPFWHLIEEDRTLCGFFARDQHRNRSGNVHGGMLATLADRALGTNARLPEPNRRQATIGLDIQFIAPARMGEFVTGTGRVLRETASIAFLSGHLEAGGRLVANLSGVWRIWLGKSFADLPAAPSESGHD
jgi:uncharacterized protein (TIGR00369 family)